jgi:hypothetical protein
MTHRHLNDEQLSAHLDGEPYELTPSGPSDESVEVAIAACDDCRHRLTVLADTRDFVRVPVVAVPPSVRAAAVEAAISEALGPETAPASAPTVLTPRWSRLRRPAAGLVGAAAAVAVLAVVGISLGLSHRGSSTATSAAAPSASHAPARGAREPQSATGVPAIRDLGIVTSERTLRARLAPLLSSGHVTNGAPSAPASGNDSASPLPSSLEAPGKSSSAPTNQQSAVESTCEGAGQQAAGVAGTVELLATVTYGHIPALVVVVHGTEASSNATSPSVAVVVARSGCRVLARTTL